MIRTLACALACLAFAAAARAQQTPAEIYGALPAISGAAISPDGDHVALASFDNGVARVLVHNVSDGHLVRAVQMREQQQLRQVSWADDDHVAFVITQTFQPNAVLPPGYYYLGRPRRIDFMRTALMNIATGEIQMPTTDANNAWRDQGTALIAPIAGDPGFGRLIGPAPDSRTGRTTVFRVDLESGRVRPVSPLGSNSDTVDVVLDENGAPLVRGDSDEHTNHWQLYVYDGGTPRLLAEDVSPDGSPPVIAGPLADGRLVTFESDAQNNLAVLSTVNRDNGARQIFFSQPNADIDEAILDPWTRRVVGARWTTEESH